MHLRKPAPGQRGRTFKTCPLCWSRWILFGELAWQSQHGLAQDEFMSKVASLRASVCPGGTRKPVVGGSPGHATAAEPVPIEQGPIGVPGAGSFFSRLQAVMLWRSQGLLTDIEFQQAKRQLGLC